MKKLNFIFYFLLINQLFCATNIKQQVTIQQTFNELFLLPVGNLIGELQPCKLHNFNTSHCKDETCMIHVHNGAHQLNIVPSIFKECLNHYSTMRNYSFTIWLQEITKTQNCLNLTLDYEGLCDTKN